MALPLTDESEVDLARVGDELAITVDGVRRLVALPVLLRRHVVTDAVTGPAGLVLRFEAGGPRVSAEPGSRLVEELRLLVEARRRPRRAVAGPGRGDRRARAPGVRCAASRVRGEPTHWPGAVDGAADLVALLRAVLADRWEPGVSHMPGVHAGAERTVDTVQHIPVRREPR